MTARIPYRPSVGAEQRLEYSVRSETWSLTSNAWLTASDQASDFASRSFLNDATLRPPDETFSQPGPVHSAEDLSQPAFVLRHSGTMIRSFRQCRIPNVLQMRQEPFTVNLFGTGTSRGGPEPGDGG